MKDKYDTTTRDWVDETLGEAELDFDAADPTNNVETARMLDEWRREFMRIMFDPNYESDNSNHNQGERP